jgi:hypothetical protein
MTPVWGISLAGVEKRLLQENLEEFFYGIGKK